MASGSQGQILSGKDHSQGRGLLGEKFTCLICGQEELTEENMRTHVLIEHVESVVCCPFCDLSGITSDEMTMHINGVHFHDVTSPSTKKAESETGSRSRHGSGKDDPEKFGLEHGGAIPKTPSMGQLKHSQSLDQSPFKSPSRNGSDMKTSHSESNISKRGKLQLNFESVNEPGPSRMVRDHSADAIRRASSSTQSIRSSQSSHAIRNSHSGESLRLSQMSQSDTEQAVRIRLQSSIHSQNDVILEEGQDNNNIPLQPNLNQVQQPDINDNVEPDINSNMPAGFSCPLCQFITSSENLIQAHVNMAHVDILSPARPRADGAAGPSSRRDNARSNLFTGAGATAASAAENTTTDGLNEYPCPICMKIYNNSGELSIHVNHEHSQIFSPNRTSPGYGMASGGSPVLTCPVCEMEFFERSRLEAHVNGHFSAEQTPIQERTDKMIAHVLQEKEADIPNHEEEKEFQKLQAMYGMADGTPYKKAYETNLERAVAKGDMTVVEFHERKNGFKYADSKGIDDGNSCTKGVIQRLQEYYRTPTHGVARSWLCTVIDHYSGSYGDKGWGCGYRNFQMLLSSLMTEPTYNKVLFNGRPLMPSIPKIQRLIEAAWDKGFDKQGCDQLGGKVLNTVKWIGATEIVATLASLRVKCRLLDFHNPSGPNNTHPRLFEWVKTYFEKPAVFKPPLYLQHQGHSRTIVGIEELKDKSLRLLIFDPSTRKKQMQLFHSIVNANLMRTLRKPLENLKAKQYQIVVVTGILSDQEYQEHKILRSEKLS